MTRLRNTVDVPCRRAFGDCEHMKRAPILLLSWTGAFLFGAVCCWAMWEAAVHVARALVVWVMTR